MMTLEEIVKVSCAALEEEDLFFRFGLDTNKKCPDQKGGILRIINERYYQFVLARHLSGVLPFIVKVEDCRRDITLVYPNGRSSNKRFAVLELKCWMSAAGERELPGIKIDINENLKADICSKNNNGFNAEHGFMLVFSANHSDKDIDENLDYLAKSLGTNKDDWKVCHFKTINRDGLDVVFWIAGYEVL
jgi:hypothetical protein